MYRYFAFLFFAFFGSDLFAQEPHLEYVSWETRRHYYVRTVHLTHDNILLVIDNTNGGTLWRINPENGEIIDTSYKGDKIKYISFSPSKTIWSIGRTGSHTISNYETNEEIAIVDSEIDVKFIDDDNVIYYKQNKIYKQNLYSGEKEEFVFYRPPSNIKTDPGGIANINGWSSFSPTGRYAIINMLTNTGFLMIYDTQTRQVLKTYSGLLESMANPTKDEFAFITGNKLHIYDINNLDTPKKVFEDYDIIGANNVQYSRDGLCLLFGGYQNSFIATGELYDYYYYLGFNTTAREYDSSKKHMYSGKDVFRKYDFTPLFSSVEDNYKPLAIQPNPSTESIMIQANINFSSNYNFELYNMQGELLQQQNLGLLPVGLFEYNLNISSYSVGTYILKISNGQHTFQSNFIKMN